MYHILANKLMEYLVKEEYVKREKADSYQLFIEYFLSLVINILIASGLGHTLEMENEMIVYSIFYTFLRNSNGGTYMKVNAKQAVSFWVMGTVGILGMNYLYNESYGKVVMVAILLISFLLVVLLAPYRGRREVFPEQVRKVLRDRSLITASIECIFLFSTVFAWDSNLVAAAIAGVFMQSVSLLPTMNKERQIINFSFFQKSFVE